MSFLLASVLIAPDKAIGLTNKEYGQLVSQARSSKLLASLTLRLGKSDVLDDIPRPVRRHFESALLVHTKQKHDLKYDIKLIKQALSTVDEKLVLLKGAAYLQAELSVGQGRLISDIDIIVPENRIIAAEKSLNKHGWESGKLDPYNERYYRKWMHEIPPMGHRKRGTTLDLHHTILPPTAPATIDASLLFDALQEVKPGVFTLSNYDMVIHSATHLFHEGEFHHGLRDLWDLDRMLRDFSQRDAHFWERLIERARALDLDGPLLHSLNYSERVFGTPIPPTVIKQISSWSRRIRKPLMDFLFLRAFRPNQPECTLPFTDLALYLLYVRSHYLRMPLYLLIPHLVRKAWMSRFGKTTGPEEAVNAEA